MPCEVYPHGMPVDSWPETNALCLSKELLLFLDDVSKKRTSGQITAFLASRRATLSNRGHKTARQAAELAPTGKLKVSKVASGYGEDMIPLNLVCLSPNKGGYMGVARKKADFRSRNGPKMLRFGPKLNFLETSSNFFCYSHGGTLKRQLFCAECVERRA